MISVNDREKLRWVLVALDGKIRAKDIWDESIRGLLRLYSDTRWNKDYEKYEDAEVMVRVIRQRWRVQLEVKGRTVESYLV